MSRPGRPAVTKLAAFVATLGVSSALAVAIAAPASAVVTAAEIDVTASYDSYVDNDGNGYLSSQDTVLFDVTTTWNSPNSTQFQVDVGYISIVVNGNEIVLAGDKIRGIVDIIVYTGTPASSTATVNVSMEDLAGFENSSGELPYHFEVGVYPNDLFTGPPPDVVANSAAEADLWDVAPGPDVDPDDLVITSVATAWDDRDGSGDVSGGGTDFFSDSLTYTVTVRNDGPVPADLAYVGLALPNGNPVAGGPLFGTTIAAGDTVTLPGRTLSFIGVIGPISNATPYELTVTAFSQPYTGDNAAPKVKATGSEGRTLGDDIAVAFDDLTATHAYDSYDDNDGSGDISVGDTLHYEVEVTNDALTNATINEIQFRTMGGDFTVASDPSDVLGTVPALGGSDTFDVAFKITDALAASRAGDGTLGFWFRVLASSDGTAVGDVETLTQAGSFVLADRPLTPADLTVTPTYDSFEDTNANGVMDAGDFLYFSVNVANSSATDADVWRARLWTDGGASDGLQLPPAPRFTVPGGGSLDFPARMELTPSMLSVIESDGTIPFEVRLRVAVLPASVDPTTSKITVRSAVQPDLLSLETVEAADLAASQAFESYEDLNANGLIDTGDVVHFTVHATNDANVKADVWRVLFRVGNMNTSAITNAVPPTYSVPAGGSADIPASVTITDAMIAETEFDGTLPYRFVLRFYEQPYETNPAASKVRQVSPLAADLFAHAVVEESDLSVTSAITGYVDNDLSGDLSVGDTAQITVTTGNTGPSAAFVRSVVLEWGGGPSVLLTDAGYLAPVFAGGETTFPLEIEITEQMLAAADASGVLPYEFSLLASGTGATGPYDLEPVSADGTSFTIAPEFSPASLSATLVGLFADGSPTITAAVGTVITIQVDVTNTGVVPLTGLGLKSTAGASGPLADGVLDPGETVRLTFRHTVTAEELAAGRLLLTLNPVAISTRSAEDAVAGAEESWVLSATLVEAAPLPDTGVDGSTGLMAGSAALLIAAGGVTLLLRRRLV